jgi:hypothetical protein
MVLSYLYLKVRSVSRLLSIFNNPLLMIHILDSFMPTSSRYALFQVSTLRAAGLISSIASVRPQNILIFHSIINGIPASVGNGDRYHNSKHIHIRGDRPSTPTIFTSAVYTTITGNAPATMQSASTQAVTVTVGNSAPSSNT